MPINIKFMALTDRALCAITDLCISIKMEWSQSRNSEGQLKHQADRAATTQQTKKTRSLQFGHQKFERAYDQVYKISRMTEKMNDP